MGNLGKRSIFSTSDFIKFIKSKLELPIPNRDCLIFSPQ